MAIRFTRTPIFFVFFLFDFFFFAPPPKGKGAVLDQGVPLMFGSLLAGWSIQLGLAGWLVGLAWISALFATRGFWLLKWATAAGSSLPSCL